MTGADLAQDLIALGAAFAAQRTDAPEHFAMVRRVRDEAPCFPAATLDAWQQTGRERIQRHARDRLGEPGLLDFADPACAAAHLSVLVVATTIDRRLPQALPDREGLRAAWCSAITTSANVLQRDRSEKRRPRRAAQRQADAAVAAADVAADLLGRC